MVIVVGLTTFVVVGGPVFDRLGDANAIDNARSILTGFQEQVMDVAGAGEGSQTEVNVRFSRGELMFDAENNQIVYEIATDAEIISPNTARQIGNLRLSSMANVDVEAATVDDQNCWMMENEHLKTCIRAIPENPEEQVSEDVKGFWRLNADEGAQIVDISPHGNDGSLGSDDAAPTWVTGLQGAALRFDGVDDHAQVADSDSLDEAFSGDNFSLELWVHPQLSGNYSDGLVSLATKAGVRTGAGFRIENADESIPETTFFAGNGSRWFRVVLNNTIIPTGEWTHLAGTFNGTHLAFYWNGVLRGTYHNASFSIGANDRPFTLGAFTEPDARFFNGTLDDVRVYDRVLTADEVAWHHEQGGNLNYIDTEDLVLYYHNKDVNRTLDADYSIRIQTDRGTTFTNNGTGSVTPRIEGAGIGRGDVEAEIRSFFGIDYTVVFTLLSGADFLKVDVED